MAVMGVVDRIFRGGGGGGEGDKPG